MKFSKFGEKFTRKTGILQLMDDLGLALSGPKKMLMLGAGNPAHIPQVEVLWRRAMDRILKNGNEYERMIGDYQSQQGDSDYINALAGLFNDNYGWGISAKNICILPGSQTSFFYLFNLLAGEYNDSTKKKILLPIIPEYIGYEDQGISDDFFIAAKPLINYLDEHTYKYSIDFGHVNISDDIAAISISRPTNPTSNVITDDEVNKLSTLAKQHHIPLIIDNAYGAPFPQILFTETHPVRDEHIIHSFSLSKLGLPGTRTSIIIANEEIINALTSINAIAALASGNVGEYITREYIRSGEILKISKDLIRPYYKERSDNAIKMIHQNMNPNHPYYLHKSEGALFLWLWCRDLPITSQQLYERLKQRGVIVVPGEYFFPGLQGEWKHKYECLRISYSGKEEVVREGLGIIADEIKRVY